jgi:Spy/CpxP family protein refolding chaperone
MVMKLKFISMAMLFVFAVALPGSLYAQNSVPPQMKSPSPEERSKKETDMMKEKLKLTDEQTQKVGDINLKYAQQMDEIRKQNSQPAERQANHEKMKKMHEKKLAEMKTVLTPEQFEQYQKTQGGGMRKEHPKNPANQTIPANPTK